MRSVVMILFNSLQSVFAPNCFRDFHSTTRISLLHTNLPLFNGFIPLMSVLCLAHHHHSCPFHQSHVSQIVPSQCLTQPMAMSLAVVRSWGRADSVYRGGRPVGVAWSAWCHSRRLLVRWKIPTSTCSLLTGQPVYATG